MPNSLAKSDKWIQLTSDIMGKPFVKPKILEAGTLGAAIIAGTATKIYRSIHEAVEQLVKIEEVFEPDIKNHMIYKDHTSGMTFALARIAPEQPAANAAKTTSS